jgi:gentisate 1,2-dioxygenase
MKLEELDSQLEKHQLSGFWRTRVPGHSSEAPYLWKWEPLLDGLLKASETIGIEQAERRAIRLVSPHLPIKSTSHTLQITFSIVNPGEVAKAHRHNMAAIRFVVQGKGAYTAVDGEKFYMEEGDLILTPNWTWHDHHNESEDPIIWLDGLDGPLIQSLNVLFFEDSAKPEQEITRQTGESLSRMGFARTPRQNESFCRGVPFRYSFKETYKGTQSDRERTIAILMTVRCSLYQSGDRRLHLPDDVVRDSAVQFEGVDKGAPSHEHGSSIIASKGQGRTKVGEGYLEWKKGDSFVIPVWQWHSHESLGIDEAILFSISDRPVMEALQLYREETAA